MWRVISHEEGVDDVPLRGAPGRLILAGVPWVTSWFPSSLLGYNMERLSELDYLVLYTKLSSCLWAHKSGRAGSTDRSAGLLVGRDRLSGTADTLVIGDPWVPMSHRYPLVSFMPCVVLKPWIRGSLLRSHSVPMKSHTT
jgi:hypothetical protein